MPQDAIALLEADHQRVETLFTDYQSAGSDMTQKLDIAQVICLELTIHAMLEEELFYPAFREATGGDELVDEAEREHQEVKDLIASVQEPRDLDAVMKRLQQAVEHHVQEEREKIFPKALSAQKMDIAGLATRIEARKADLVASMQAA